MAFTGTAVVTQVSDSICRITGLSLAAGAAGVIGLSDASGSPTPGVLLPAAFQPKHYAYAGDDVPLVSSIEVTTKPDGTTVATAIPVAVVKSGTSTAGFRATLTNTHATLATPDLEIMIKFHE